MNLSHDETITDINCELRLIQKNDGLTFGSDAYLLSAYVRRQYGAKAADLGSGTGIIPLLLLARDKIASCEAVEVQPEFASLISRNAELNGFADKIRSHCTDVRGLNPERLGGVTDIVVSNPPYMKTSGGRSDSDRKQIARHELLGGIADFCGAAYRVLKHGGLFYIVWRADRLCDLICALRDARLEPKRMTFVHARRELAPCLLLCEAKKGASAGIYVTPPLIMYERETVYSETLAKIYETGDFDELYKRP